MVKDNTCELELKKAHNQLIKYAQDLHTAINKLKDSHFELEMAYIDTVNRLAQAVEIKDKHTGHHGLRIRFFSAILAHALELPNEKVLRIYNSAAMHDVGKISIPDSILLKPGPLTEKEFEVMKTHTTIGAKLLANSKSNLLRTGRIIALNHHERWDGTGYPNGLKGSNTPVEGRIVGLVDVYDALRFERPYKKPFSLEKTLSIIKQSSGKHFDPLIVETFFKYLPSFTYIDEKLKTPNRLDEESLFKEILPDCSLNHRASITKIL